MGLTRRAVALVGAIALVLGASAWENAHVLSPMSHVRSSAVRLTIARLQYDGGGDWYANPSSLPNLLEAIRQRTSLKVEKRSEEHTSELQSQSNLVCRLLLEKKKKKKKTIPI